MYTDAVNAMDDKSFTFVPLAALGRAREAALAAKGAQMTREVTEAIAKGLSSDLQAAMADIAKTAGASLPEAVQKLLPDVLKCAVDKAVAAAMKGN